MAALIFGAPDSGFVEYFFVFRIDSVRIFAAKKVPAMTVK